MLTTARRCAILENRVLTNSIETFLRRRVDEIAIGGPASQDRRVPRTGGGAVDAV